MTVECAFFGVLGADAEQRTSKTGAPFLRMNIRAGNGDAAIWVSVLTFDAEAIDHAAKFVKNARCYVEGKLSINEWTGKDGSTRTGLSCLSWHCRLAQIGRNKPKKSSRQATSDVEQPSLTDDLNDSIPF
jgi:single-stranded DNA-binding protein